MLLVLVRVLADRLSFGKDGLFPGFLLGGAAEEGLDASLVHHSWPRGLLNLSA